MNRIVVFLLAGFWAACGPRLDTVEQVDSEGNKIVYARIQSTGQKQGDWKWFNPQGTLMEWTQYEADSLHGFRRMYYESGALMSEEQFEQGMPVGSYRKYFESGQLYIVQPYQNGKLEGLSVRYYPNGKVMEEVMLKNNEENGPFKEYYENGNLRATGTYQYLEDAAVEQGELMEYDSTGTLVRIAHCESGICHTKWKK
jgi:antitoxin component YwqK of YwqJK toxin-antitoxin module